jgi:antagonist of KipI
MNILIKKESILTTVQDLGRTGFRRFGINPGGVMDRAAARLINIILGNDENAAVLEMHFPAAEICFDRETFFAVGGADFAPVLDGAPVSNWRPLHASANSSVSFTSKVSGERVYVAVRGGFQVEEWLGSKSTNLVAAQGGFNGRRLKKGDLLEISNDLDRKSVDHCAIIASSLLPRYSRFPTVRVIPGAEFDLLTAASKKTFRTENFVISANSDRMGFRLRGQPLHLLEPLEMVSSAVSFGTIQLLPDGQLIILMADHQTSGGYTRIANVIERDLPLLAQLGPNDKVAFHEIDIREAEDLLLEFERNLTLLKTGVKLMAMA